MKKIIESLGMSIKEFSTYYEIPYNTVRQWWNDDRTPPKWVVKLLNELIELKKKGEQIRIEEKLLYCNIKTIPTLTGRYRFRTYYTKEKDADKEIDYYNKNMPEYHLEREIYKKIQ